jgi:hypothetical protein
MRNYQSCLFIDRAADFFYQKLIKCFLPALCYCSCRREGRMHTALMNALTGWYRALSFLTKVKAT